MEIKKENQVPRQTGQEKRSLKKLFSIFSIISSYNKYLSHINRERIFSPKVVLYQANKIFEQIKNPNM